MNKSLNNPSSRIFVCGDFKQERDRMAQFTASIVSQANLSGYGRCVDR